MKRQRARAGERWEGKRKGSRQGGLEVERVAQVQDRGRIIEANSASGRQQREAAFASAAVGKGRDTARKLARRKHFEKKLKSLALAKADMLEEERVKQLGGMAVFYRGSREHSVKLPIIDEGKMVRREVWNPVVGDRSSGVETLDDRRGLKIESQDVWLIQETSA